MTQPPPADRPPPGPNDEPPENAIERGWRWLKAHPKLVVLLVRVVPLLMLLFGFAAIVYIQLKAQGFFGGP